MHKKIARLLAAALTLLLVAAACGSDEPVSQQREQGGPPPEPPSAASTLTVEEIVERSRAAMNSVTSFKVRGTMAIEDYDPESSSSFSYTMEWQHPDRLNVRYEPVESNALLSSETRFVGQKRFARDQSGVWIETGPPPKPEDSGQPVSIYLDELGAEGMQLVSSGEMTGDGTRVYRLEFSKEQNTFSEDDDDKSGVPRYQSRTRVTLLVDQDTFLLVSRTVHVEDVSHLYEDEGFFVETNLTDSGEFYDYNEPVVIELPSEYEPWTASESLSRTAFPASRPAATPTPAPTHSCSYPTATWPGCGIRTAADVEAMLAVFPDDDKIAVGDDIVIAFAFEGPPQVDWQADVSIWHVPSASVVQVCFTDLAMGGKSNLPGSEIRLHGTAFKSKSAEATERLQQVLDDEVLMERIRSRAGNVEVRCVFIG